MVGEPASMCTLGYTRGRLTGHFPGSRARVTELPTSRADVSSRVTRRRAAFPSSAPFLSSQQAEQPATSARPTLFFLLAPLRHATDTYSRA